MKTEDWKLINKLSNAKSNASLKVDRNDLEDWKIFVRGICDSTKTCKKFPECLTCLEDFSIEVIEQLCLAETTPK